MKDLKLLILFILSSAVSFAQTEGFIYDKVTVAPTPPLGWNSYTGYSTVAPENELIKNIDAFAIKLKPFGYQYITVDNGWFTDKQPEKGGKVYIDEYGRPKKLGLDDQNKYILKELWTQKDIPLTPEFRFTIPPDDCLFFSYNLN